MIETDTIVEIHIYPDTPIGSYIIFDASLDTALDRAMDCLGLGIISANA